MTNSNLLLGLAQALLLLITAPFFAGLAGAIKERICGCEFEFSAIFSQYRVISNLLMRQRLATGHSGLTFQVAPYLLLGSTLVVAAALPMITMNSPIPAIGDMITLIYIFAVVRFLFVVSGLDTGSPFAAVGSSREAVLGILVEPTLILSLWVASLIAGSTQLGAIAHSVDVLSQINWLTNYTWMPIVIAGAACAFACYVETGNIPFDVAEAEQELQEGPLTEYSGPDLAVFKLGLQLKSLVAIQLFLGVFLPWGEATQMTATSLGLALVIAFLKQLLAFVVVIVLITAFPRYRYIKVNRTTWAGFGVAFLALVSWLVFFPVAMK